ncbi:MAG TPA: hypothetical protein VLV89_09150 [Candidatus Acidoferrum sp.]|nr:hypothetical protein [Candidatus Acidoferrum sp.]
MTKELSHISSYVAFLLILAAGGLMSLIALRFYRQEEQAPQARRGKGGRVGGTSTSNPWESFPIFA